MSERGLVWACAACRSVNPLAAESCSVCGSPFARTVSPTEPGVKGGDPNLAALYALLLPGAGHAYIGLWGEAVARAVISGWVIAVLIFALVQASGGSSLLVAASFGGGALVLWVAGAHDAYWAAKNDDRRAILRGRRWLYVTIALIAVLIAAVMVGMLGAQNGTSS